jgi:DNA invertase Pin-like site-specific DNA recombinase
LVRSKKQADNIWSEVSGRIISATEKIKNKEEFLRLAWIAERETQKISHRVRTAMAELQKRGKKTGGDVPYGYDYVNRKLKKNKKEQAVIRKMLRMRNKNIPLRKIAEVLMGENIPSRRGPKWNAQTINEIIKRNAKKP